MALLTWVSSDPLPGRIRAGQDVKDMRYSEQVQAPRKARRLVKLGSKDWVQPGSDGADAKSSTKSECILLIGTMTSLFSTSLLPAQVSTVALHVRMQQHQHQHNHHHWCNSNSAAYSNVADLSWSAAGDTQYHLRLHADHPGTFAYRDLDSAMQV
jgi:hypothetical protein